MTRWPPQLTAHTNKPLHLANNSLIDMPQLIWITQEHVKGQREIDSCRISTTQEKIVEAVNKASKHSNLQRNEIVVRTWACMQ